MTYSVKTFPFRDPCEVYELVRTTNSILLESQQHGSHSYIALDPHTIFSSIGETISITKDGVTTLSQ